jgi:hypothetical protein
LEVFSISKLNSTFSTFENYQSAYFYAWDAGEEVVTTRRPPRPRLKAMDVHGRWKVQLPKSPMIPPPQPRRQGNHPATTHGHDEIMKLGNAEHW